MDRRRKKSGGAFAVIVVALMLLVVILGLSVFFKVSVINVEGVSKYTAEEIIASSGIRYEDSTVFLNESAAAVKIKNELSYVDEVRIIRKLPSTVTIQVSESVPMAYFESEGSWWITDDKAKVLERTESFEVASQYIELRGITPVMPAVGDVISLGEGGAVRLGYLKDTLAGIRKANIQSDVDWLDFSNLSNVHFSYRGIYTVILGRGDDVQDKLWLLNKMLELYPDRRKAKFDVSEVTVGHYIPE